jgi:hypothetical protein
MCFLMAQCAEGDQILGNVITQSASRLNMMDLEALRSPAPLATPAISLQDFMAKLAIGCRVKPQAWSSSTELSQSVTWTFSSNCCLCSFGRPSTSRVNEGSRASVLPDSKLTPARKSAQIISRQ